MVCSKCGNQDAKGAICDKCGAPLVAQLDSNVESVAQAVPQQPVNNVPPVQTPATPMIISTVPVAMPTNPPVAQVANVVQQQNVPQQPVSQQPIPQQPMPQRPMQQTSIAPQQVNTQMPQKPTEQSLLDEGKRNAEGDVSIPTDFKLLDDEEGEEEETTPLDKVKEEENNAKAPPIRRKRKKSIKRAVRKTGKLIKYLLLTVGVVILGYYLFVNFVEPSGFMLEFFDK